MSMMKVIGNKLSNLTITKLKIYNGLARRVPASTVKREMRFYYFRVLQNTILKRKCN